MYVGPTIRSFRQLDPGDIGPDSPVVTLFSGGLDSSYLLLRLREAGFRCVHALSVNLGEDETTQDKQWIADELGVRLHVVDGRQVFAEEYVGAAIRAQAVYLGTHPVSSSLSRPLIARFAVELAQELGAAAVLHTANRSQNTLRRLNGALSALGFGDRYGSPYDLDPVDRDQKIAELKAAGLNVMSDRIVSGDSNVWCREFESGILDDPEDHAVPEHMYRWSRPAPGLRPVTIDLRFDRGVPVAVDGTPASLLDILADLNVRVGAFGLGRFSGLEHLDNGDKVLELREMPAAWLLLRTYRHLEGACLEAETIREKMHLEQLWVREALEGRWYGDLRPAVQAFIDSCARHVAGNVTWRLSSGGATTQAIVADHPRYVRDRQRWEEHSIRAEGTPWLMR